MCRFPASGSSSRDFAALPTRRWTTRTLGSPERLSTEVRRSHAQNLGSVWGSHAGLPKLLPCQELPNKMPGRFFLADPVGHQEADPGNVHRSGRGRRLLGPSDDPHCRSWLALERKRRESPLSPSCPEHTSGLGNNPQQLAEANWLGQ